LLVLLAVNRRLCFVKAPIFSAKMRTATSERDMTRIEGPDVAEIPRPRSSARAAIEDPA
jgi:hypothetical protein